MQELSNFYDLAGNLTRAIDGNGLPTSHAYRTGQLAGTVVKNWGGVPLSTPSATRDQAGNALAVTDGAGNTTR